MRTKTLIMLFFYLFFSLYIVKAGLLKEMRVETLKRLSALERDGEAKISDLQFVGNFEDLNSKIKKLEIFSLYDLEFDLISEKRDILNLKNLHIQYNKENFDISQELSKRVAHYIGLSTLVKEFIKRSEIKTFKLEVSDIEQVVSEDDSLLIKKELYFDTLRAPNCYIFDIEKEGVGGLYIPVAKAFAAWRSEEFLKEDINALDPNNKLSVSVYWEDEEDLIAKVSLEKAVPVEKSKIKVMINKSRGEGNAVIALHSGVLGTHEDPVLWSWHIWITDDPEKETVYHNNIISYLENTFMDRNLGAVTNSFLGNDWNKSGGLMYQWGRKDPFPPMMLKDGIAPVLSTLLHGDINADNYSNIVARPSDDVKMNIRYAVHNPHNFLRRVSGDPGVASWFTKNVMEQSSKGYRYNLWADNKNGGVGSIPVPDAKKKSPYDPCPSGWRVPVYASSFTHHQLHIPFGNITKYELYNYNGRNYLSVDTRALEYFNSGGKVNSNTLERYSPTTIYPGLGFDFKGETYKLGKFPLTGHTYEYEGMETVFQDEGAESDIWGATMTEFEPAYFFSLIADPVAGKYGRYEINTAQISNPAMGKAVRCTKDPLVEEIGHFPTDYIYESANYEITEGIDNPNSYMLVKSESPQNVKIPVNKAYAMYNQYLSDYKRPEGKLSANIYWTTNKGLLTTPELIGSEENASINLLVNPNQSGNAVVSLHIGGNGDSTDPVLWSWHIWVPNNDPAKNTTIYTTEKRYSDSGNRPKDFSRFLAYNTTSGFPPLTTEFMDRNLGALEFEVSSSDPNVYSLTGGMQYQWGRKDPIPSFINPGNSSYSIYLGANKANKDIDYKELVGSSYITKYTELIKVEESEVKKVIKKMSENPLLFTYRNDSHSGTSVDDKRSWLPKRLPELWGHADKKSPFDPCPEGWRIPDYGLAVPVNSPFYKEDSYEWNNLGKYFGMKTGWGNVEKYGGIFVGKGWVFKSPEYNIGQYPVTGVRGELSSQGMEGSVYMPDLRTALWSSSMRVSSGITSNAFALGNRAGNMQAIQQELDMPQYKALPVRCARDVPRFTEESIAQAGKKQVRRAFGVLMTEENLNNKQSLIYPNPVQDYLNINSEDQVDFQIFSYITNSLVMEGKFRNKQVNVLSLKPGVYIIKLLNKTKNETISLKILKE